MKILCVIDNLGLGGAQRQLVNIAGALRLRGYAVTIASYYPESFFKDKVEAVGVEFVTMQKKGRWSLSPAFRLREIMRSGGYDAVLAFLQTPSIYAELAHCGLRGSRLVVSERNYSYGKKAWGREGLRAGLHLCADVVISNSHSQAKWLGHHYPWLRRRLVTIWNGVSSEWFQPASRPPRDPKILRLVAVGRVAFQKNLIGLAQAVAVCRDSYNLRVHVSCVGATDTDSGSSRREVQAFLKANRLEGQWNFMGVRKDVQTLMQEHDALVLPSFYEGLPNVVCEALACGLPVLASNVCDNPLLVEDGVRGSLFDPKDTISIAESIRRFSLLSEEAMQNMSDNAQAFARMHLSLGACTDAYEKVLCGSP